MEDCVIKYIKHCIICDKVFYSSRCHAKTCCTKCRSILYKLNEGYKLFCSSIGVELYELTGLEIKNKVELVKTAKMDDGRGNLMELIFAHKDSKGEIKRVVFRNPALKYLEAWNDYRNDLKSFYYKY